MSRMKQLSPLLFLFFIILLGSPAHALDTPKSDLLHTQVSFYRLLDEARQTSGLSGTLLVALQLDLQPDWYTYADDPGGMGKPTKLTGTTASGTPVTTFYPKGIRKPDSFDPSVMVNTYKSGTKLFVLIPGSDARAFPLSLRLDLLLCHPTKCVPMRRDISIPQPSAPLDSLPQASQQDWWPQLIELIGKKTASSGQLPDSAEASASSIKWDFTPKYLQPGLEVTSLLSAILMGLLAGLILNIMPCVLPVVSLKLSALLNSSSMESKSERIAAFREHNIFFSLGVLSFFLFLAIVLGATGSAWGALFQNQWLVLGVAAIILALSLSLFGLFHLPVIDLKFGSKNKNPHVQAFFTGNLTTLLATPCSGPFLGGVLSWALIQGPVVIATVFISIGIGMAFPYLLLAMNPGLSRFLPKSGPWIEFVEKGIAFFLVATAFYLFSIAVGSESLRFLAPLWALLFGGWLWIRTKAAKFTAKWATRTASLILLALLVVWTTPTEQDTQVWEEFIPIALQEIIGTKPLLIDFTADWCPTCKALEASVLTDENVMHWKKTFGVTFIKVDMTQSTPEAENLLRALGSASIPTAAFFPAGPDSRSPLVLRDIFTKSQLENILESWEK